MNHLVIMLAAAGLASLPILPASSHEGEETQQAAPLGPEEQAVAAILAKFAAAYQATDIDAIGRLTPAGGGFSHIEGTYADWSWDSYAAHLGEEMPAFSATEYRIFNVRPEVGGSMAFATFDWSLDVVIISEQFEDGRHPVSMSGMGTAVLVKDGGDWKLRHVHTAREKTPSS